MAALQAGESRRMPREAATTTGGITMLSKKSRLLRAAVVGFFLALAAWGVTFLSFLLTSATVEVIGNALRPGGAVAVWLIGVPTDPYGTRVLLATEFVVNWIFYAGLALVGALLIEVLRRNGAGGRGQAV